MAIPEGFLRNIALQLRYFERGNPRSDATPPEAIR